MADRFKSACRNRDRLRLCITVLDPRVYGECYLCTCPPCMSAQRAAWTLCHRCRCDSCYAARQQLIRLAKLHEPLDRLYLVPAGTFPMGTAVEVSDA